MRKIVIGLLLAAAGIALALAPGCGDGDDYVPALTYDGTCFCGCNPEFSRTFGCIDESAGAEQRGILFAVECSSRRICTTDACTSTCACEYFQDEPTGNFQDCLPYPGFSEEKEPDPDRWGGYYGPCNGNGVCECSEWYELGCADCTPGCIDDGICDATESCDCPECKEYCNAACFS